MESQKIIDPKEGRKRVEKKKRSVGQVKQIGRWWVEAKHARYISSNCCSGWISKNQQYSVCNNLLKYKDTKKKVKSKGMGNKCLTQY